MILRRIFGPKTNGNREWRRLQNIPRSPNTVRVIKYVILRLERHVVKMKEGRNSFKMLTGKPNGNRSLGRSRHRWDINIRMYLAKIAVNTRILTDSDQDSDLESPC
jgi:hypothetical protein